MPFKNIIGTNFRTLRSIAMPSWKKSMRTFVPLLVTVALLYPASSHAADVLIQRDRVSAPAYLGEGRAYRIRGAYQDSGWALEVPVYHDCRVHIVQTPRGVDRTRRCLNTATINY
jgi:hypothetical protein